MMDPMNTTTPIIRIPMPHWIQVRVPRYFSGYTTFMQQRWLDRFLATRKRARDRNPTGYAARHRAHQAAYRARKKAAKPAAE